MSRRDALGAVSFRPDRMPAYHVPTRTRRAVDWIKASSLPHDTLGVLIVLAVLAYLNAIH
jgi:hypothetical protein